MYFKEVGILVLGILVVFLSGFFSYLSLGEPNKTKKVFVLIGSLFMTFAAGITLYHQDIEQTEAIERLSRFGSHIYWDETKISYRSISYPNNVVDLELRVLLKISSRINSQFGKKLDVGQIVERSKTVHAFDYKKLDHKDAVAIYTSHADPNGVTVDKDETDSNIHSFQFFTDHISNDAVFDFKNSLSYQYGANARTAYRSLFDLNDSFLVFNISAKNGTRLNNGAIQLELKSNLGYDIISIKITKSMLEQYDARIIVAGVYIPENYWILD